MCECDIKMFKMILEDLTSEDLFKLGLAKISDIESLLKVIVPKKKQLRFKVGDEVICSKGKTGNVFTVSNILAPNDKYDYIVWGGIGRPSCGFYVNDEDLELYVKTTPKFKEGDLVKVVRIEKYNNNGNEMNRNLSIGMFGILSVDLNRTTCTDFILNNEYGVMKSELELVDVEKDKYVKYEDEKIIKRIVDLKLSGDYPNNYIRITEGKLYNETLIAYIVSMSDCKLVPKPQAPHVRYFDVLPNGNLKYTQSGWVQTLDKWIEFFETSPNPSNVILPQLKELKNWRILTQWKPKKD